MPRLNHNEAILNNIIRDLQRSWDMTSFYWNDRAREDFEKAYLDELLRDLKRAADAIGRINRLLYKAIRECS